jgi:hypothetical protein
LATYGEAKLPEFVRSFYHFDAFESVQAEYSAYDRNRILWRARARGASRNDGGLAFDDAQAVAFTFRFFFAFDSGSGELRWAHHHPRFDVVSAEHVGPAILYVSQEGELGALDAKTGAQLGVTKVGARILGATFDAEGYRPGPKTGAGQPPESAQALASIVWDKDARFGTQKVFALNELGRLTEGRGAVTETLLEVLLDEATPQAVYAKAGEVLVTRKDASGVPALVKALETRFDYIKGTKPRAVDWIARALGAIGRKDETDAIPALLAHLDDPETPLAVVKEVVHALAQLKSKDALPALRSYLLLYRADPLFASDTAVLTSTVDALLALGGGGERELVAYVAGESRTQPRVAEYAKRALEGSPLERPSQPRAP